MKILTSLPRASAWLVCLAAFAALPLSIRAAGASDPVAKAVSSTAISLTWNPGDRDRGFWIRRTGPDGTTHDLGHVFGYGGSFQDRALEPDTTYTYSVATEVGSTYDLISLPEVSAHTPAWQNQDIGQVGAAGSVQRTGDVISVTGSGADIWGNADAFQFVHQPWTGDGALIVRVNSVTNTAGWAKAGIMFRESLAPGSRYVMAAVNPNGDGAFLSRATTDGASDFGISVYTYTPQWLKLVRHGTNFQTFQSRDGIEWTLIRETTLDLPATIYAGLAVTSHNEGMPCTAVFEGFNLSTWEGSGGTVTNFVATPSSTRIDLAWENHAYTSPQAHSFLVELSRDNFRTLATRVSLDFGRSSLFDVDPNTTYYVRVRPIFSDGPGLSSPILAVTTRPIPPGAAPAAPGSLSANAVASSQVNLMWADNSDNESRFVVERSTDGTNYTQAATTSANATSVGVTGLAANTTYTFRVRAIRDGAENFPSAYSSVATATTSLTPVGSPYNVQQPRSYAASLGFQIFLETSADGGPNTFQWLRNGLAIPDATKYFYSAYPGQPEHTGIYTVVITNGGGSVSTEPAVIGLSQGSNVKVAGAAREVGSDIRHPNGNVYDQVLLEGAAASIVADPGQVTRLSYLDLNGDIVQVEFSGAGTLSITLDNFSGPAPAPKYNQPGVNYVRGHATIVIGYANETTNVSVFSVGRANAVNQALFREGESYDGVADLALLAVLSTNGRFGGVFGGDAHFFSTRSLTGIYAPNVQFDGSVTAHDITANDGATPMLWLGQATHVRIAGGNLAQPNSRPVQVGMFSRVQFIDGATSAGRDLPAQSIQGRLEQNGRDVTAAMTSGSTP